MCDLLYEDCVMKILTNWNVPIKAPKKFVKKATLTATVLVAGVFAGTGYYYNNCDRFTRTKVEDMTYKVNESQIEEIQQSPYNTFSYETLAQEYKTHGLYAGSIYNQCQFDMEVIKQIINELEESTGRTSACKDARSLAISEIDDMSYIITEEENPSWKKCVEKIHSVAGDQLNELIDTKEYNRIKFSSRHARKSALAENNDFRLAKLLASQVHRLNRLVLEGSLKHYGFSEDDINRASSEFTDAYGECRK